MTAITLNRKQLDKLFQITNHFREITKFDLEVRDSESITVTFSLFDYEEEPLKKTTTADKPTRRRRVLK